MTTQNNIEKIYNKIKEALEDREKNKIEPVIAFSVPLFNSLDLDIDEYHKTINELIRQRKIVYGITLNDVYFKIPKK